MVENLVVSNTPSGAWIRFMIGTGGGGGGDSHKATTLLLILVIAWMVEGGGILAQENRQSYIPVNTNLSIVRWSLSMIMILMTDARTEQVREKLVEGRCGRIEFHQWY